MNLWLILLPNLVLALGMAKIQPMDKVVQYPSPVDLTQRVQAELTQAPAGAKSGQLLSPDFPSSPEPRFNSDRLNEHLKRYLGQLAIAQHPPDILIVGSSRALQGVDPEVLEQALQTKGYRNVSVYNFGINGATAQVVDFLVRQLLTPDQLPRLILWADGARAFNSGRVDRTMEAIAASPGYKHLQAGIRPTSPPISRRTFPTCGDQELPLMAFRVVNSVQSCPFSFIPRFRQKSARSPRLTPRNPTILNERGFLPIASQFNPSIYYQNHPRIPGRYDGDYQNFDLAGSQAIATANLLKFTQAQNIPLIFVNLPLTPHYLDSARLESETQFQHHLQQWQKQGLIVANLLDPQKFADLQQPHYFQDPSHINRYGAADVSRQLAQTSQIPWSRLKARPQ